MVSEQRGISERDGRLKGDKKEMKERTKELLAKVDEEHDWVEGQVWSGGGTELHSTDICQVCNLRRHYQSDIQNGIEGHYRFSIGERDLSLKEVIEHGCE